MEETAEELKKLIDLGETMARKYWVTCTNPPYAGTSNLSARVNNFVKKNYPDSKADLFAVFIERCRAMTANNGFQAMITQQAWMFIASYENFRKKLLKCSIVNMTHLGAHAFDEIQGEVVQTVSFVLNNNYIGGYKGSYVRLLDEKNENAKRLAFLQKKEGIILEQNMFAQIPRYEYVYWASEALIADFKKYKKVRDFCTVRNGLTTGDNDRFLRIWFEIDSRKTNQKWFPCNKGGTFRRWYGNRDYLINWEDNGYDLKHFYDVRTKKLRSTLRNIDFNFRKSIVVGHVASGDLPYRLVNCGAISESAVNSIYALSDNVNLEYLLGVFNSKPCNYISNMLSPTLGISPEDVLNIPVPVTDELNIEETVNENLQLSKNDWDSFENSWDFTTHPLVYLSKGLWEQTNVACMMEHYYSYLPEVSCPLEICYLLWQGQCKERFEKLKANEEELNRIFIDIYGLQDELTPEVEEKDVTVRKADLQRDIKSLLSYAVGCMFGRYSLDVPGLVLAGQPFEEKFVHASNAVTGTGVLGAPGLLRAPGALYLRTEDGVKQCTFAPDVDNVIPITDEEYLEDDIIARLCDWLKVVYGADTLEANLDYIAKALGNKGTTSREVIRNYFVNDFFKDHCQTYSVTGSGKRPIYWLFDSGKQNGFKALVYLHRYTPDTIGTLRVDYLHKMQRVYESEINRMQDMMDHTTNAREAAAASKRKDKLTKQLKECRDYDEKISHLALSRIALDLDDGVKVNYRKLQTAADGQFYEVLADSKNIMAKEKK